MSTQQNEKQAMKFIITVDTESDIQKNSFDVLSLKNLDSLSRFQALCEKYAFKPTYLVTYEVGSDDKTAELLKNWQDSGKAEIGTHLHPWTTPPSALSDREFSFPHELSDEELRTKFKTIHNKITEMSGRSPTSYRAGRWGFDARQAEILSEFGYIADCSITPKVDWRNMGGPDFRREYVFPHKLASGILEVPMTILFTGFFKKEDSLLARLFSRMPGGLIKKVFNRIFFRQKWFRVFPNSAKEDWSGILESAKVNNLPYVMFMIHSNELHLGTSKDTRTEKMIEHTYKQLEEIFSLFHDQGAEGLTLSDYARTAQ
jgi:hypothetical protein